MIVTQEVRKDGAVASNIRLKTKPEGRYRVCFRLTRSDTVQVDLVNSDGELIKSLAEDDLAGGDEAHCYDWDGMTDAGQEATPGIYRARLTLEDADRVATSGERLQVHPDGQGP
jgi:flagellar hook assembly protein FlgD